MKTRETTKERFTAKQGTRFKVERKQLTIRAGTIAKFKQKAAYGSTRYSVTNTNGKLSKKLAPNVNPLRAEGKVLVTGHETTMKQALASDKETTADQKSQPTKHPSEAKFQQNKNMRYTLDEKTSNHLKNKNQSSPRRFRLASNKRKVIEQQNKQMLVRNDSPLGKTKNKQEPSGNSWGPTLKTAGKKQLINQSMTILSQEEDTEGLEQFQSGIKNSEHLIKTTKQAHGFMTKNQKYAQSVTHGKLDSWRFSGGQGVQKTQKLTNRVRQRNFWSRQKAIQAARQVRQAFVQGIIRAIGTFTTSNPLGWLIAGFVLILFLFLGILFMMTSQSNPGSDGGTMYVEHWDGKDAYHSSLLAQRYGIKAEQIDSFIKNEGFTVDERATGKEFLRLQASSGIDVRMLVAFAQMESSFGTAGVARQFPKSNLFGYGAVDNDPNQGAAWDNTRAVTEFRNTQIDNFSNRTIAIMDERAQAYHQNRLKPGQFVYWTALDAGKPRAAVAEKLDHWIDTHGGTPKPPGGYGPIGGGGGGAGLAVLDKLLGQPISGEFGGAPGECYAVPAYYAHSINPAIILRNGISASAIGEDYPWAQWHWQVVRNPSYRDMRPGDIINFRNGANMGVWLTDPLYGHTAVIGKLLGHNQLLIYDQNPGPLKTWTVTYIPGDVASVIHPPK
ncbi:CHAP domain-containing protein [Enterococcus faecalis]|uniref:CHAP domain-containing protein n=1 Tax=Enterococcus faecalis TaxID=1351 RepID=UPI002FBEAE45